MIDHVGFPVSNYAKSKALYEKALAAIGYSLIMEVPAEGNPSGAEACGFGKDGKPDFWLGAEGGLAKPIHVALAVDSRAQVDAFYKAALAAGAKDNGAPGVRAQYHPNYYAAFVFDFDGHNIEVVCHKPA